MLERRLESQSDTKTDLVDFERIARSLACARHRRVAASYACGGTGGRIASVLKISRGWVERTRSVEGVNNNDSKVSSDFVAPSTSRDAMADPATRRALLGMPSDVFATWHDPHAEVRRRARESISFF